MSFFLTINSVALMRCWSVQLSICFSCKVLQLTKHADKLKQAGESKVQRVPVFPAVPLFSILELVLIFVKIFFRH